MQVALVTGYFDPLLDAHARRLGEIAAPGRAVFVAIAEPPRPLLQARARAELVAALAMVDYVMLAASMPADWFAALVPDAVFREEAADERRTGDLIKHVQSRQT
jgi:glycerol-3-phosphate cytidylyltransferase-like family protein